MERGISGALSGLARITHRKSMKDLASLDRKEYPMEGRYYEILDDCGRGVSATVHRAYIKVLDEVVAIKKMNLESYNCNLEEIIHEAQTMRAYNHPHVLPLLCSFVNGQELWMVTPFVSGGSVLHIMKYAHPDGLDEITIATIMKGVLKALEYVHKQGGIHRDIKAGNILLAKEGHVFLGDFGVAASMERSGSWGHGNQGRNTFVGTPCWMAPEVMEQTKAYDSSADIWSFGITLLEMAHGHAPFAKFPPMKVLLMTLQNPPPTLDDKGLKRFSKAMRDVVTRCLQKEPSLRPTASQLLEHKFFKQAKDDEFLAKTLMAGLPPLGERVLEIREGKAATNARDNDKNFARSQDEYKKGISTWNFDVKALKEQAALEPEDEDSILPTIAESDEVAEGTLSGLLATQAAAFMSAAQSSATSAATGAGQLQQQPEFPVPASNGGAGAPSNSVFASLQGQQQLLRDAAQSIPPPPLTAYLEGTQAQLDPYAAGEKPSSHGGESTPLSPGNVSPQGLSREGSVQGPMAALASTPQTKQKIKQQGRFQIYEPGSQPPPMSPIQVHGAASLPVGLEMVGPSRSQAGIAQEGIGNRISEDGIKRGVTIEAQDSVFDESITTGEPKKKGRFLVVEQAGLSKVASAASLADSGNLGKSRSEAGKDGQLLGRPPMVPTPSTPGAQLPVAAVLPRLQELLEHASQQQQAMQRLFAAVQEAEKGKAPTLFNQVYGPRSLFTDLTTGGGPAHLAGSSGGDSESGAAPDAAVEALRVRLADLEAENTRLRLRNQQLEALLHPAGSVAGGDLGQGSLDASFASGSHSFTPAGATPNISPREGRAG